MERPPFKTASDGRRPDRKINQTFREGLFCVLQMKRAFCQRQVRIPQGF